jgi:hypothetical protein
MMDFENRWTRWHSDGWVGTVIKTGTGEWLWGMVQGGEPAGLKTAGGLADAQHQAEDVVRASGHRCTARCSYWVPDTPEDL